MKTLSLLLLITIIVGSIALLPMVAGNDITRGFKSKYRVTVFYPTISASTEFYSYPDEINQWIHEFEVFIQPSAKDKGNLDLGGIRLEQKMLQGGFFLELEEQKWLQWRPVYDFSYKPQGILS